MKSECGWEYNKYYPIKKILKIRNRSNGKVREKLNNEYNERIRFCDMKNSQLQSTAESMRLSILGRDTKAKDGKPLGVVDAYAKGNTT